MPEIFGDAYRWGTNWINGRAEKAWDGLAAKHGVDEKTPEGQKLKNTFFHMYSSAMAATVFPDVAREIGRHRERGTWPEYREQVGDRRDTYKDLYNNELGISLSRQPDMPNVIWRAMTDGTAILNTGPNNGRSPDGRIPTGANSEMSLRQMEKHATSSAASQYNASGKDRRTRLLD